MNRRKALVSSLIIAGTIGLTLTACKNNNKTTENNDSAPTAAVLQQEPCQTDSAKKLIQFSDLKNGDLVAEIVVKDYGTMKLKLFSKQAPKAVENFITHAKDGYYDGVTFHRVIQDFMIQGGDPEGTGYGGESIWGTPFEDEFSDDLYPYRGSLCMANSGADTNGSQFFIVQGDEAEVDRLQTLFMERYDLSMIDYIEQAYSTTITQKELDRFLLYGGTPWLVRHHTVFGQLMEGFDVLDAIAASEIPNSQGNTESPIIIETIKITEYQE